MCHFVHLLLNDKSHVAKRQTDILPHYKPIIVDIKANSSIVAKTIWAWFHSLLEIIDFKRFYLAKLMRYYQAVTWINVNVTLFVEYYLVILFNIETFKLRILLNVPAKHRTIWHILYHNCYLIWIVSNLHRLNETISLLIRNLKVYPHSVLWCHGFRQIVILNRFCVPDDEVLAVHKVWHRLL